ncbi:protein PIN-LIKES 7-like isoform X1 [Henckelia pumila]|uniref:protein PIN-LIKES 7-like isoform X1 n=1 Tax=Henckelia pumila TaxID=405737 RepID=UPI003C6E558B
MGFWSLLKVASMPVVQVLLISTLGAFMATDYLKLLSNDARKSLNKIVFFIFTPSLVFTSLAQTVRFQDIITWWFMPVNIGITFLVGGSIGWIAVKLIKPEPHIQNLVIAMSSAGNLGNILLIIIPAICKEDGNPFGDKSVCSKVGLSYVSFSMALGAFFIWTHSYHLIRSAGVKYRTTQLVTDDIESSKEPNEDLEDNNKNSLLVNGSHRTNNSMIESMDNPTLWNQILGICHKLGEELLSPPVIAAVIGFTFGTITWLRDLIIGDLAPLRVIQDSIKLLGDGTIPCITLILGGNLTQGWRKARLKPTLIIVVICVRYIILPIVGIGVVKAASHLGFLPSDPLFHFVLMIQFTLPPAMSIGTMTQLFDVAQAECSVLFLWTYLVAALAVTGWSTIFMWLLS